jgi:hypothetical protein
MVAYLNEGRRIVTASRDNKLDTWKETGHVHLSAEISSAIAPTISRTMSEVCQNSGNQAPGVNPKCIKVRDDGPDKFEDLHRANRDFAEEAGGLSTECARLSSTKQLLNHRSIVDEPI